jgi:hypothetical protein
LIFEATAIGTELANALEDNGRKQFDGFAQLVRGLAAWSDFEPTKKAAFDAVSGANKLLVEAQDLLSGLPQAEAKLERAKLEVDQFERSQNDPLVTEIVDGVQIERLAGGKLPGGFRKSLIDSVVNPVDEQARGGDAKAQTIKDLADGLVAQFEKLQDAAVANGIATQKEVDAYRKLHTVSDNGKLVRTYVSFMGDSARDIDDIQGVSINRSFVDESDGATRVGQPAPSLVNLTAKIRQLANRIGQADMREALLELAKTDKSNIVKLAVASEDRTENYYKVFTNGDVDRIKILDDDVADALFYIPSVESKLGRAATTATTTFGRLFTQYVATFAPINAFRDAATRAFNFVGRKELRGVEVDKARLRFLNSLFGTGAAQTWTDAWNFAMRDQASPVLDEARRNGAILLFTDSLVSEADVNKQMQALNPTAWNTIKNNASTLHGFVEKWNRLFEIAIPLATYKALTGIGKDGKQAAAITSDMMNFRAKGETTKYFAAVYPFFNATAQDIRQTGRSLSTRRGKIEFAGLAATAALLYAVAREADEDDELTGGKKIDSVSVSNQERNLMLRVPGTDTYINIPIGFGAVQLAWVTGMRTVRAAEGIDNPKDAMLDVAKTTVKSLSPVGASEIAFTKDPTGWIAQTFTPALAKPVMNVALNKNFMGSPITYARANGQTFKSQQGNFATPEFFKDVADELRDATGFDMAPEQIRELMSGYLAGPAAGLLALANDRAEKNLPSRPDTEGGLGLAIKALGVNRAYRALDEVASTYALENKYADEALAAIRRTNVKVPKGNTRLKGQERIEAELLRVSEAGEDANVDLVRAYLEYQFAAAKLQRAKGVLRKQPDVDLAQIGDIERERLALMREFIQKAAQP